MCNDASQAESDDTISSGGLAPRLAPNPYVFCSLSGARYGDFAQTHPLACIAEPEGLTLVLVQDEADREGLAYSGLFRCISLGLYSSLETVGLTAMISSELAQYGISANMIAGYHHDHVLVPAAQAEQALDLLRQLGD